MHTLVNPVTVNADRSIENEKYFSQFSEFFETRVAFRQADDSLSCRIAFRNKCTSAASEVSVHKYVHYSILMVFK
jgi:hypothetical protein